MTVKALHRRILILLVLALFVAGFHLHHHDHEDERSHCLLCLLKTSGFTLGFILALPFVLLICILSRFPGAGAYIPPPASPGHIRAPPRDPSFGR